MNDMRNRLAAWLSMYDQGGMGDSLRQQNAGHSGFNPSPVDLNGARMQWAQQMLDRESQQAPDYFDFEQERTPAPADRSVGPIRDVNALRASLAAAPMGQQQPQQGLQRNRLLAMMGGNYGR